MDNKLCIVHTNDLHGFVVENDNVIGYPKIAGFADSYRKKYPKTLVLDAGDSFQGSVYASYDGGESLMNIINSVGYDAATAGNADIYLGKDKFCYLAGKLEFPILCSNLKLKETGQNLENTQDYTIVDLDGLKVGIIGVTPFVSLDMVRDSCEFTDPIARAKELIAEIGDEVDVLVGLLHLGTGEYQYSIEEFSAEITDFDVLIDAHSHNIMNTTLNGTPSIQTGAFSTNVGVVVMDLDDNNKVTGVTTELFPKESFADVPVKPETQALVDKLLVDYKSVTAEVVGNTEILLNAKRGIIRTSETNSGNLFTDAMCDYTGNSVAVTYSAFIAGEIGPGEVTQGDILALARIEQMVLTVEITGAQLLEGLNHSVSLYPGEYGLFFQVSGIKFTFNPNLPKDNRVVSVLINGEPLVKDKKYEVACCESLYMSLPGFSESKLLKKWDYTNVVMRAYFDKYKTVNPQVEGRILPVDSGEAL